MDREYLQLYIDEHIPIVKAMKFTISEIYGKNIVIEAPYQDHINHRNSVFGGSISALLTLAGWAKVRIIMEEIDSTATIVIQESNVKFLKPVLSDFAATTEMDENIDLAKFEKMYRKFGKARINIPVYLKEKNKKEVLAEFQGTFVIVRN